MVNRENKLNEANSPQKGAGVRDDRVRRLGRSAGDAKDGSPFGQAAPPDVRALKPGGREAEVKDAVEPARYPGPDTVDIPKKSRLRPLMFALLPLALVIGAYWYVTGGQAVPMDDAYVEADKVGISTDVSGTVAEVGVTENQRVQAGQILYRLDDLQL